MEGEYDISNNLLDNIEEVQAKASNLKKKLFRLILYKNNKAHIFSFCKHVK